PLIRAPFLPRHRPKIPAAFGDSLRSTAPATSRGSTTALGKRSAATAKGWASGRSCDARRNTLNCPILSEGTERAWVPGRRGWRAEIRGFSIRPPKEIGRKTGIERDDAEQSKVRACPFPSSAQHAVTKAKVPVSFQGRRVACPHCKGSFAVARQPSPEEDV